MERHAHANTRQDSGPPQHRDRWRHPRTAHQVRGAVVGMSERTISAEAQAADEKVIAGVAYVFVDGAKRELAGLNPRPRNKRAAA